MTVTYLIRLGRFALLGPLYCTFGRLRELVHRERGFKLARGASLPNRGAVHRHIAPACFTIGWAW